MKIRPVEAKLFNADWKTGGQEGRQAGRQAGRRTDILKLIVALHNFEHATKSNDV